MEQNTQNTMGPGLGETVSGGSSKKGNGLVATIVAIVLIIIAVLLLTSKSMVVDNGTDVNNNIEQMPAQEEILTQDEVVEAQAEAGANLSTGDDVNSLEADLESSLGGEIEF